MRRVIPLTVLIAVAAVWGLNACSPSAGAYYDLGGFHEPVTTTSPTAQTWFDRGLAMCYAFNHEEAVRCFEKALQADPNMAMGMWGLAYAQGPNINNTEIPPDVIAAAHRTLAAMEGGTYEASEKEKGLIKALALRYADPAPDDRRPLNKAYADAMREVHGAYPDDPMVTTLFAESLMLLRPWHHWSADGEPAEETPGIVTVLEDGLERHPQYPGLCHFYIHLMEASPTPEVALPAAECLRGAMPDAGHLVHMPSHIDVLLGHYGKAIHANQLGIEADKKFLAKEGPNNFYSLYRLHNYHFLVYAAMFDGQRGLAMEAARVMPKQVPEAMTRDLVDFLDGFMATPIHVMVRFGMWDSLLAEPEPADYLPMTRAVWRYGRAVAYSALGRVPEAEAEQAAFKEAKAAVPESSLLFNNTSRSVLEIADAMVAGEIAYRRGEYDQAFEYLREAVRLDDALNYDEPWGWMQPARHSLGALLLEQKHFAEAEAVYRRDLERHPNNVWALHGLAECLDNLGRDEEAARVRTRFTAASARCDVTVDRSCYCKTKDLGKKS